MTAIAAVTRTLRTMADGTVRVTIDIEPTSSAEAFAMLGQPDTPIAVARLTIESSQQQAQQQAADNYGGYYTALHKIGWFYNPRVAPAWGSDAQYQAWCRKQPSAYDGAADWHPERGESVCEYAHVRRAGNAGTGCKPEFSGIPLTHLQHQLQHQHGESHFAPFDFEKAAAEHLKKWICEQIRAVFRVDSMRDIPPNEFRAECVKRGIGDTLPAIFN